MNGVQSAVIGIGALLVVGVGAALMFGGGGAETDEGLGTPEVMTPATTRDTPQEAPTPLEKPKTQGSGATIATARATHYDPNNPPVQPAQTFRDYVCRRQVPVEGGITTNHEGTTYHFCSEACRDKFVADPHTILMRDGE